MNLRKWIYGCIFLLLCACGGDPGARSPNISLEAAEEAYDLTLEDQAEAYQEILRRKMEEDLEKIQLKAAYPEFDLSGTDIEFLKQKVSKDTRLESLQTLNSNVFGDTLFLKMVVRLEDSGNQILDTVEVSIIRKEVSVEGETVFATEILYR